MSFFLLSSGAGAQYIIFMVEVSGVYCSSFIREESAPVNISCQRKPSIVIMKRFLTGGTGEMIVFSLTGFSVACKHIANMMQVKTCFIVCGLTKKVIQCNRSVT